jgi:hypothetical protein
MKKLNAEQISDAMLRYEAGETYTSIGNDLGVSNVAVRNLLVRRGVVSRDRSDCQRRISLREDAFEKITPGSAYWIGFLMADGTVVKNEVAVVLSEKDANHVMKFRLFMGSGHAVTPIRSQLVKGYSAKPTLRYSFKSTIVVSDLSRYGVVPNKSLIAKCSNELVMNRDFWRGVVDGDGSLSARSGKNGAVVRLCGSKDLLEQFVLFVKTIVPLSWRGSVIPQKSIWQVSVAGLAAAKLAAVLYKDAETALDRKAELASRIMQEEASAGERKRREIGDKCANGHLLTAENAYRDKRNGTLGCLTCKNILKRKYRERLRKENCAA